MPMRHPEQAAFVVPARMPDQPEPVPARAAARACEQRHEIVVQAAVQRAEPARQRRHVERGRVPAGAALRHHRVAAVDEMLDRFGHAAK